jgi:hypothetical protein
VIGIRPNDGFVLIHSNLSVFNTPIPLAESQINCDINDNNNNELKPYYNHSENCLLLILGEGGHLLLIDKRHNPYVNDSFDCILFVGSEELDLFSLYDLRSFPRSSCNPNNINNSSDEQFYHTKTILLVKPKAKISKYWSFAVNAFHESDQKFLR